METRANYVLIGSFTLAVIAAAFGFVLWFQSLHTTKLRSPLRIVFEGPAAGLEILDSLGSRLARWPQFHIARAELLHRTGRTGEAIAAFRRALELPLPHPEHAFLERRITELCGEP